MYLCVVQCKIVRIADRDGTVHTSMKGSVDAAHPRNGCDKLFDELLMNWVII